MVPGNNRRRPALLLLNSSHCLLFQRSPSLLPARPGPPRFTPALSPPQCRLLVCNAALHPTCQARARQCLPSPSRPH